MDIEIGKFSTFVKTEDNVHLLDLTAEVAPYLPDLVATRMAPYQAYGKQLGLDYHLGSYLMYYNRELLEQAGIDPDAIKTWDDYIAAGKTFRRVELAIYDDRGGVQAPQSYAIEYWDGSAWKAVANEKHSPEKPAGGQFNETTFDAVTASKVRVVFTHRAKARSGVSEVFVWAE